MTSTIQATLCISSESITAEEIGKRINLTASRTGEPKGDNSDWRFFLDSALDETESIELQIEFLCALLEERKQQIASFPQDVIISIWCTIDSDREFTGFSLNAVLMGRVAIIPADVIFSVYKS